MSSSSPPPAFAPEPARIDRALLLLTALAFVVRAIYLLLEPVCGPTGDEPSWIALGIHELGRPRRGLDPFRVKFIFYPPLYPYFIAVLYRTFGTLAAVQWVQAAAGSLLVPAVGRAGERAFGRRAGLLAAGLVVVYPDLVWFSVRFWSETLFMVFLWWAIERTLRADAARSARVAAVAGLLFGLAALTRELALYLAPIAGLWLLRPGLEGRWRPSRQALRNVSALGLGLVLCVAPWTLRNALVFKAFIPVSTMGGLNLWQGNTRTLNHLQIYEILEGVDGPVAQDRYTKRMAWESIRDRQPMWIFEKLGAQMPQFWRAGQRDRRSDDMARSLRSAVHPNASAARGGHRSHPGSSSSDRSFSASPGSGGMPPEGSFSPCSSPTTWLTSWRWPRLDTDSPSSLSCSSLPRPWSWGCAPGAFIRCVAGASGCSRRSSLRPFSLSPRDCRSSRCGVCSPAVRILAEDSRDCPCPVSFVDRCSCRPWCPGGHGGSLPCPCR